MSTETLLAFLAATALFAYMPGPALLYTAAQTIARGRRAGLLATAGIHIGCYVHVLAAAFGLSAIFSAVPTLYMVLKLVGGAYLVFLGVQMIRTRVAAGPMPELPQKSTRRAFLDSVLVEVLNPKVAVFFIAFLPQFVSPEAGLPIWIQFLVLGTIVNCAFTSADLALNADRAGRRAAILVTDMTGGGQRLIRKQDDYSDDPLADELGKRFRSGKSGVVSLETGDHFLNVSLPSPRLVIVGAVHISQALVPMAEIAGLDVTVIDPRTAFATEERFPGGHAPGTGSRIVKFGPWPVAQAAGCILAHKTKLPGRVLKKGHPLTQQDCEDLAGQGIETLVVARLDPSDIGEDEAAERLARSAMGPNVSPDDAFTGRMNLYADQDGVLVVNEAAITAANRIDPAITFATLANHSKVATGRMVATAKIISFALPENKVSAAEAALKDTVRIAPFASRKVGLVATRLPHLKEVTMDKTRRVLEDRLRASGSAIIGELRVAHQENAVAAAMQQLIGKGAEFLILFGASAVVDRQDVLPAALDLADGTVHHLGMPVDPGNLLMLGELSGRPVLGAPGCARSPKENGFDWVLDRLLAGLDVGAEDLTAMGVGGLLMEIGTRPQPREQKRQGKDQKVAAIVLAAGKSSRMGGPNKLLAHLDGKALVRHAAEAACGAALTQTVVVTGHLKDAVAATMEGLDITLVHNPDFADGMAGSIRTGMNALSPDIDAVIIMLGDMPRIDATALGKLLACYRQEETSLIVTATADGKRGNPVLWDRRYFGALKVLSGDVGARHIIADNSGFVAEVELGAAARLDLDTPEALLAAEGDAGNYVFPCNNRVEPGVSYCTEHSAIVYIPPEERRRNRSGGGMSLSFRRAA
eukprot:g866.t1